MARAGGLGRVLGVSDLVEVGASRQDRNPGVSPEGKQIFVPGDDEVRFGQKGTFQNHVVFRVSTDASQSSWDFNESGILGEASQCSLDIGSRPSELTGQSLSHLIVNLGAVSDRSASGGGANSRERRSSEVKR